MENWPNFFIVGVSKAGTTSLYEYLKKNPNIYMSPIKEPNYFSIKTIPRNGLEQPIRDKKKYFDLFKKVKHEKIVGEASATYLSDPEAPKLIHQIAPNAKILICLRDPVERAYSAYLMHVRDEHFKTTFHNRLQIELKEKPDPSKSSLRLHAGLYSKDVKRYLNIFGRSQVKIIIFEEFITDVKKTIEEVLQFLGSGHSLYNYNEKTHNPFAVVRGPISKRIHSSRLISQVAHSIIPKSTRIFLRDNLILKKQPKPKMDEEDRKVLVKFYFNDVIELKSMLGRKLPWPNFP